VYRCAAQAKPPATIHHNPPVLAMIMQLDRSVSAVSPNHEERCGAREAARLRRERIWSCLALFVLLIAWDQASRLDARVSIPRMRLTQVEEPQNEVSATERSDF
jgi:hypothetical protein